MRYQAVPGLLVDVLQVCLECQNLVRCVGQIQIHSVKGPLREVVEVLDDSCGILQSSYPALTIR